MHEQVFLHLPPGPSPLPASFDSQGVCTVQLAVRSPVTSADAFATAWDVVFAPWACFHRPPATCSQGRPRNP